MSYVLTALRGTGLFAIAACGPPPVAVPVTGGTVVPPPATSEPDWSDCAYYPDNSSSGYRMAGGECAEPPSPVEPCPVAVDADAVAACAAGSYAALNEGVGFNTVQEALDATAAGGWVWVCPGVHTGPLVVATELTLAAVDPTPGSTVITNGQPAVAVNAPARLVGLSVSGGDPGVNVSVGGATLDCLTVEDNLGKGIVGAVGPLVVTHSSIRRNHGALDVVDLRLEDAVVEQDQGQQVAVTLLGASIVARSWFADMTEPYGIVFAQTADVWTGKGSLVVSDTVFTCLQPRARAVLDADVPLELTGSTFVDNDADEVVIAGEATLRDVVFSQNAGTSLRLFPGGGVAELTRVSFIDGSSDKYVNDASALSVESSSAATVLGTDLTFHRNVGCDAAVNLVNASLTCEGCDFGLGGDDNAPFDAIKDGRSYLNLGSDFTL
jgi:hypothetical protein